MRRVSRHFAQDQGKRCNRNKQHTLSFRKEKKTKNKEEKRKYFPRKSTGNSESTFFIEESIEGADTIFLDAKKGQKYKLRTLPQKYSIYIFIFKNPCFLLTGKTKFSLKFGLRSAKASEEGEQRTLNYKKMGHKLTSQFMYFLRNE